MMANLSPAAQAVLDAGMEYSGPAFEPLIRKMTAAALRAAADQMSSHHSKAYLYSLADGLKLLAIADELEGNA